MKRLILIAFIMLLTISNALALSIIKPQKGDTYFVGQVLTVELQPLPDEEIEQIIISTNNFNGTAITTAPFKHDFRIDKPVDGEEKIGIVGVLKDGRAIFLSTYVYVQLPSNFQIQDFILEKDLMIVYMMPSDVDQSSITADGIFTDGSRYPLNSYNQTKYQSNDESIARVDPNGVVTGVHPGTTFVKVTAGNITKAIKVKVIYKLDPINRLTVVSLDKKNEIKWEKSLYEGEVVSEYRIYRSKDLDGMGKKLIGTITPGTYTFTDSQPVVGVKYYYSVQAYSQKYNTGSSMKGLWVSP